MTEAVSISETPINFTRLRAITFQKSGIFILNLKSRSNVGFLRHT
jgi:hypothetical protein